MLKFDLIKISSDINKIKEEIETIGISHCKIPLHDSTILEVLRNTREKLDNISIKILGIENYIIGD